MDMILLQLRSYLCPRFSPRCKAVPRRAELLLPATYRVGSGNDCGWLLIRDPPAEFRWP